MPEQSKSAETMPEQPDISDKQKVVVPKTMPDKANPVPMPVQVVAPSPRLTIPAFTKTPPNELYRRLLPAVLFLLTFVTVMTILLIYMDTVGKQSLHNILEILLNFFKNFVILVILNLS